MRKKYLSGAATLGLLGLLGGMTAAPVYAEESDPFAEREIFEEADEIYEQLVNEARAEHGLEPLESYDPLGDATSGALDWSNNMLDNWHGGHHNGHIYTGYTNAGCTSGSENIIQGRSLSEYDDPEELAQRMFDAYQGSPPHWENGILGDHEFHASRTVITSAEAQDGTTVYQYAQTQRFGSNCSTDNISDVPEPEGAMAGPHFGSWSSMYDSWVNLGHEPPEGAVPSLVVEPIEPPGDLPEEPTVRLAEDFLSPGGQGTIEFLNFEPDSNVRASVRALVPEGESFHASHPSSPTNNWVTETRYTTVETELLDEGSPEWEALQEHGHLQAIVYWSASEGYSSSVPYAEGQFYVDIALDADGVPQHTISVDPSELAPGDSFTVSASDIAPELNPAHVSIGANTTEGDWQVLAESEAAVDVTDGSFSEELTLPEAGDAIWDSFDEHITPGDVAVYLWDENNEAIASMTLEAVTITLEDNPQIIGVTPPGQTGNTVEIPETTGVTYSVNGEPAEAGEIQVPMEGLSVTAEAQDGYEFQNGAITEWDFEFDPWALEPEITIDPEVISPEADFTITISGLE